MAGSYDAHNVQNYSLGKGIAYFDRMDGDGNHTGERDLGNAPAFSLTPAVETLDHFSSRAGIRSKDHSVDVQEGMVTKFTLDEYDIENLALALYGDVAIASQNDGVAVGEAQNAQLDRYVKLDYRNLTAGSVTVAGYIEGTDFTIDYTVGRIFCLSTGGIAEDELLVIGYTYGATTQDYISIFSRKPVEGFFRFVGNTEVGPSFEVELWRVKLKITSDMNFITDDWGTLEFEGEVLKDETGHAANPWGNIRDEAVSVAAS